MKKFLRFIFHTVYTLSFIAAGIFLLDVYFEKFYTHAQLMAKIEVFIANDKYIIISASILLAVPLLYMFVNLCGIRKETFLKYNTPEGEILISVFAVEDFIRKIGRNFREIKDVYPSITLKGKDALEVKIKLKIWSGVQNLPIAIEEIQKEIRIQIQNMIGIENVQGVHVFLAKDSFAQRDIPTRHQRSLNKPKIVIKDSNSRNETIDDLNNENSMDSANS
ncbi:alkaline shock response membrane anchor protein AmaP [bacterium]|nr:alkaline shock response membrane anchor protein AmaP [bacterium]